MNNINSLLRVLKASNRSFTLSYPVKTCNSWARMYNARIMKGKTVKVTVGGIPMEFEDADTAVFVIQKLMQGPTPKPELLTAIEVSESPRKPVFRRRPNQADKMTFAFLEAIYHGGERGAQSEHIAKALDVKPQGIGSRLRAMREVLHKYGFQEQEVYARIKIPGTGHFWRPQSRFDEAHDKLKKLVSA